MSKYTEYLKSQGATDEDIKTLTAGPAGKAAEAAFDKALADAAEADRLRGIAEADLQKFNKWYTDEANPAYVKMQNELVTERAARAKSDALIKAAQEQGLIQVAENQAADAARAAAAANSGSGANAIDTSKFVTADSLAAQMRPIAEQVGENLAALQDMVLEHSALFPGQRLNVRELRKAAVAAGKPVVEFWEAKYNVPAARDAAAKAEREAYEKKLRDEGAAAAREEFASKFGNPDTRPLMPSSHALAPRPATGRDKQPWEADAGTLERDRVTRAAKHVVETISAGRPN